MVTGVKFALVVLYAFIGIFLFFFVCLILEIILMGCGINVQEKTVPSLYKNEISTQDIRENFTVDKTNLEFKIKRGLEIIADKKIVLCLLARDVENKILTNVDKIMLFVKDFKDYRIVIFENDSVDYTRQRIREWSNRDNKVILLSCCDEAAKPLRSTSEGVDAHLREAQILPKAKCHLREAQICECRLNVDQIRNSNPISEKRIHKMAKFRNKYLDYVFKHFSDYDYMMVADIDIRGGVYREGYLTCFADDNWDAIFAKGIKPFPFMFGKINMVYDTLAFLDKQNPTEMKKNIMKSFYQLQKVYNKKVGSDNVPVLSAFNGAAVYNLRKIIESGARYDCKSDCEHIDFHKSLSKLYANPSFIINMGLDNETQMPFKFVFNIFKNLT